VGCEARKIPAGGDVFFLDFSLYRTYQDLATECVAVCNEVLSALKIGIRIRSQKLTVGIQLPYRRNLQAGALTDILQGFMNNVLSINFPDRVPETG
jgi:hypothetical protein